MTFGRMRPRRPMLYQYGAPVSGSTLLYAIIALVLLSSLAVAIAHITPAASQGSISDNLHARAAYLAYSGINAWTPGRTGTYAVGDGRFTLGQSGPNASGNYTVTSLGTVRAGTAAEANFLATASRSGLSPITFTENLDDFGPVTVGKTANNANAITVYSANTGYSVSVSNAFGHGSHTTLITAAYASGSLVFSKETTDTFGTFWYTGSRGVCDNGTCADGLCASGTCTLGKGLRAYFGFAFSTVDTSADSRGYGDGFTFTIANATTNDTATAAGGPASGSRGEYLGYAGPGPSGCGITSPKLAVEVDVYPNLGHAAADQVDSRADHATPNHVALVWWGDSGVYDDNVHGAGSSPANPVYTTAATQVGYVETARQNGKNWLEDGAEHTMRLEIHREDATIGGTYRVKVWIDATASGVDDVTKDFTAQTPQLDSTTALSSSDHAGFNTILFGWTEGTGGASQTVAIHDFSLEFRH